MQKLINITGAVLLGTTLAHEQRGEQRVSLLKQKLAHLNQDARIIEEELAHTRAASDEIEVQRGRFTHAITHHGGDILSGAADLANAGANIYQAVHNHPNVESEYYPEVESKVGRVFGKIGKGILHGAEAAGEFLINNVQDSYPEVERGGFSHIITHHGGDILSGAADLANAGTNIYNAVHNNNLNVESEYYPEVESKVGRVFGKIGKGILHGAEDIGEAALLIGGVQSGYPEVQRGGFRHVITHHGGDILSGAAGLANAGANIYQAVHNNNLNVESEYPEVARGGFGHVITHHGGDILSGAAGLANAGANIYQAVHNNNLNVESQYPEVARGGFGHIITHHGGDILSGAADLANAGTNIYQAVHNNNLNVESGYPEVQRGGFGHIITHHGGDILSGAANLANAGVNIYHAVHGNNVMSEPYDSDDEDEDEEEPEV